MKKILLLLPFLACITMHAEVQGIHRFGTYNIRYVNASNGDTGERLWANRRTYVAKNILGYDFDIVGMQEVTGNNKDATTGKSQLQDLRDMLVGYADHSVEREGKSYSYNSIFYKTSKYNLIETGSFYVNEHPETPGEGWGQDIARTCIWVYLEDKATKQDFYFVCTHVNYGPTLCGIESGKLIGRRIRELVGQTPVVLVGDFNMSRASHEEAYRGYASHFYDLSLTAPVNICLPEDGPQINCTTTGWDPATKKQTGNEFDYIFYDHMEPISRHVITDYYPSLGRTVNPSDHYPVLGLFRLGNENHPTTYKATDMVSFEQAMATATQEDTILLTEGVYKVTKTITPPCSMIILGGWNADFTEQTGMSSFVAEGMEESIFTIPHYYNITLDHVELSGGNNTTVTGGGAIYSYGPNIELTNCYIHDNTASVSSGGAIAHKGQKLYISNCRFENNTATAGGAIWAYSGDVITIHDSRFEANEASAAGGAVEAANFQRIDVQRSAFINNTSYTRGALDIIPAEAPKGAYVLNCSFIGNTLKAKKGLATATKKYGGAALWADMAATTAPLNIGHCSFIGNHTIIDGKAENFAGNAVALMRGKTCVMNSLILANDQIVSGAEPTWADLYIMANDVNLWRNTYNLTSASTEISGWEQDITNVFGGECTDGVYTPQVKENGTYPIYKKQLANYDLVCLPTTQRLCESAFTYDLNGDGYVNGYVSTDQINNPRPIKGTIGAVEYTGDDTMGIENAPQTETNTAIKIIRNGKVVIIRDGKIYNMTGQIEL